MKKVCMILVLCLLVMLPCCKKKLPTQPDIPAVLQLTITSFSSEPSSVEYGESSVLSWSTKNATTISINQGIGTVSATGTEEVSPETTTTYTLTAKNSAGQKTQDCTVEVTEVVLNPPIIEYFTATPESIKLGEYSTLSWSVTNVTALIMEKSTEPGSLPVPLVGTQLVSPIETITYTLTATNDDGEATASCEIEIKKWAELELSTIPIIPKNPFFCYDSVDNCTHSDFTVILTETAGVGGQINDFLIETGNPLDSETFPGGTFSPFGSFSRDCSWIIPGKPIFLIISIEGVDDNGYMIELNYQFTIFWSGNDGIMTLRKIIEGASHHK